MCYNSAVLANKAIFTVLLTANEKKQSRDFKKFGLTWFL